MARGLLLLNKLPMMMHDGYAHHVEQGYPHRHHKHALGYVYNSLSLTKTTPTACLAPGMDWPTCLHPVSTGPGQHSVKHTWDERNMLQPDVYRELRSIFVGLTWSLASVCPLQKRENVTNVPGQVYHLYR